MHVMKKYNAKPQRICSFFVYEYWALYLKSKNMIAYQYNINALMEIHDF